MMGLGVEMISDFMLIGHEIMGHRTSEKLKSDSGTQMHFLRFSSLLGR
jgi:hypothetical protein